jgi:hypothetical protein
MSLAFAESCSDDRNQLLSRVDDGTWDIEKNRQA